MAIVALTAIVTMMLKMARLTLLKKCHNIYSPQVLPLGVLPFVP